MKIKQIRRSKGISAEELLKSTNINLNLPQYSMIESGKALPRPEDLLEICKTLGVEVVDVLDESDKYYINTKSDKKRSKVSRETNSRFDGLPPAHPKRTFRMSDDEWEKLTTLLGFLGYNSVGNYLRCSLFGLKMKSGGAQ